MPKNLNWSKNPPDGAEIIEAAREIGVELADDTLPLGEVGFSACAMALRDAELVFVKRGQLRELIERMLIAEGMKIAQARIHAETLVAAYIATIRNFGRC